MSATTDMTRSLQALVGCAVRSVLEELPPRASVELGVIRVAERLGCSREQAMAALRVHREVAEEDEFSFCRPESLRW